LYSFPVLTRPDLYYTWLPYAHPAAPSHVSGVMSGIILKTGIYGIMRILLLMPDNKLAIGYIILAVSVISGYGVMLAIVQHNPAVAGLSQY
jgi:formate hydrogenlyase subunit 3/multisubunit Na+/H+ antiporter MnhD subunit